jgi:hypothetical protein
MLRGQQAVSVMMTPGPGLDLVVGLAAALIVDFDWYVEEMYSRSKARDEPRNGRVVNTRVLHVV